MRRIILIAALFLGIASGAAAQHTGISFEETKDWPAIVAKAKAEGKLIFVDCYTDWCGPCKALSANVFTQAAVGDYFNANFISAKLEMEKDRWGIENRKLWEVRAYPTMLFVDPNTEKVVHRIVGAGTAEWLIENGRKAKDPAKNFGSMEARYESGDRDPRFVMSYIDELKSKHMQHTKNRVATDYLLSLTADQLATYENWQIIKDTPADPMSEPVVTILSDLQKFYDIPGVEQREVDAYLTKSIADRVEGYSPSKRSQDFDKEGYDQYFAFLRSCDHTAAKSAIVKMETVGLVQRGQWKKLMRKIKKERNNKALAGEYNQYSGGYLTTVTASGDRKIIEDALKFIDVRMASVTGDSYAANMDRAFLSLSKYNILISIGETEQAGQAERDFHKYTQRGIDTYGRIEVKELPMY